MRYAPSFSSQIFVGLVNETTNQLYAIDFVKILCKQYCDQFNWSVAITPTDLLYKDGYQPGCIVTCTKIISQDIIIENSLNLAKLLIKEMGKSGLIVVFSDQTVLVEKGD